MRKIAILPSLALVAFSAASSAHDWTVKNTTGTPVIVEVKYLAPGWCSGDRVTINPGQSKTVGVGACCTDDIWVKTQTGGNQDINAGIQVHPEAPAWKCVSWKADIVKSSQTSYTMEIQKK